jgi:hypothetical protein
MCYNHPDEFKSSLFSIDFWNDAHFPPGEEGFIPWPEDPLNFNTFSYFKNEHFSCRRCKRGYYAVHMTEVWGANTLVPDTERSDLAFGDHRLDIV